ncbi:MAG: hypothetical protein U1E65_28575 [Myxococcota bacterium]
MNTTKTTQLALGLTLLFSSACASTQLHIRPGSTPPDVATDKFLIMPVDIHGLPGDSAAQQAALFGGFVAAFQDKAVPLQPIKPVLDTIGLNNLSWEMAEGMYHLVSVHNTYDFKEDGGFHGGDSKLPLIIEGSAKLVETAAKELKLDFKPKYVAVAHIDSTGSSLPKTVGYRVIGGIYNVDEGKIDQVIWYESKTADDDKAVLAEMAQVGSKLYGLLFAEKKAAEEKK